MLVVKNIAIVTLTLVISLFTQAMVAAESYGVFDPVVKVYEEYQLWIDKSTNATLAYGSKTKGFAESTEIGSRCAERYSEENKSFAEITHLEDDLRLACLLKYLGKNTVPAKDTLSAATYATATEVLIKQKACERLSKGDASVTEGLTADAPPYPFLGRGLCTEFMSLKQELVTRPYKKSIALLVEYGIDKSEFAKCAASPDSNNIFIKMSAEIMCFEKILMDAN